MFRTCRTCFRKGLKRFTVLKLQCAHKYCKRCLRDYVEHHSNKPLSLRCPDPTCSSRLGERDLRCFLSRRKYRKLEDLINRKTLEHSPCFIMCSTRGCDGYGVLPLITSKVHDKWICPRCHLGTCTNCRTTFHEGMLCEEYQRKEQEELVVTELPADEQKRIRMLRRHTKTCPYGHRTRKNPMSVLEGLDGRDMGTNYCKCAVCEVEFCWVCRNEYRKGHFNFRLSYCPIGELLLTLTVNNDVVLSPTNIPQRISEYVVGDHDSKRVYVYSLESGQMTHNGALSNPNLLRPAAQRIIIHIRNGTIVQVICPKGSVPFRLIDHAGITVRASPAPPTVNPYDTPRTPMTPAMSTPGHTRFSLSVEPPEMSPSNEFEEEQRLAKRSLPSPLAIHELTPPQREASRVSKPFSTPSMSRSKLINEELSEPPIGGSVPLSLKKVPLSPNPKLRPSPPVNLIENPTARALPNLASPIISASERAQQMGQTCPTPYNQEEKVVTSSEKTLQNNQLDIQNSRLLSNHLPTCLCRKCLLFRAQTGMQPSSYFELRPDPPTKERTKTTIAQSPKFFMDQRLHHRSIKSTSSSPISEPSISEKTDQVVTQHPPYCLCSYCLKKKARHRQKKSRQGSKVDEAVRTYFESLKKSSSKQRLSKSTTEEVGLGSIDQIDCESVKNASSPSQLNSDASDTFELSPEPNRKSSQQI
ncbi:hypothetical protein RCL1_001469 [Eukaryota sp. TZLM3-RCL]